MFLKKLQKKILAQLLFIMVMIVLMPLGIIPALRVQAAAGQTDGIGYYVRAVLPDNQISNNLSYFDLRMQPGQSQTLEVEVVNESDKVITVDLAAVSASTNRNGIIEGVNLICTREICGAIDMQEIDRTFREMHIIK